MNGIAAVFYRDYRQRMTNIGFVFWDLSCRWPTCCCSAWASSECSAARSSSTAQNFGYTAFLLPGVLAMVTLHRRDEHVLGLLHGQGLRDLLRAADVSDHAAAAADRKIGFNVLLALIGSMLAIVAGRRWLWTCAIRWDLLPLTARDRRWRTAGWFFLFSVFAISSRAWTHSTRVTSAA